MLKLIQWIFFGHVHKYEQVETAKLTDGGREIGKIYIMRCNNCGKMKKFEVIV